jgi:hypothetical protein
MTNERMVNRQATLHIERPSRRFRDAKRSYRVLVDREVRGRVREGDVLTLTVAPGAHTVQARLDWTGSVEQAVDLEPGSTTTLIVAPAGQRRWLHIGAAAAFSYFVLRLIINRTVGSQDARAILTIITTAALLVVTVVVFRKVFMTNDKGE